MILASTLIPMHGDIYETTNPQTQHANSILQLWGISVLLLLCISNAYLYSPYSPCNLHQWRPACSSTLFVPASLSLTSFSFWIICMGNLCGMNNWLWSSAAFQRMLLGSSIRSIPSRKGNQESRVKSQELPNLRYLWIKPKEKRQGQNRSKTATSNTICLVNWDTLKSFVPKK